MKQSFLDTISLIKSDMQVRCLYENKPLNSLQVIKFMINPAQVSCVIYRFQKFFYCHHLSFIASILKVLNGIIFTVHIDSKTDIGAGLFIMHASFICIGPYVRIGKNCMLPHQNSICPSPFYSENSTNTYLGPTIGDNFVLGGGGGVYGDITLGNDVKVAMNSLVDASYGDGAVLFGVPAKNTVKATQEEGST